MHILFYYRNLEGFSIEHLSAFLKKHGHKTELIFDPGFDNNLYFRLPGLKKLNRYDNLIKIAEKFKPDLIGLTSLANLHTYSKNMAKILKKKFGVPIIVGGIQATSLPERVLKDSNVDFVCRGEGEHALLELVNSIEERKLNYKIRNIWFKKDEKVIKNPLRPLIKNIDTLPFPDKDLYYKYGVFKDRVYVTSMRGCSNNCTYCVNHYYKNIYKGKGQYVRRKSVRYFMDELHTYIKKYKPKTFDFMDETFTLMPEWVKEFLKRYKKEIALPFRCYSHPKSMNREIAFKLKQAGCKFVFMGINSGDPFILKKVMGRNHNIQDALNAVKIIKEAKIKLQVSAMFASPNETPKQMWKTVDLMEKVNADITSTFNTYPFAKTKMMEYCLEHKCISKENFEKVLDGESDIHHKSIFNHQYKNLADTIVKILPFYVKSPRLIKKLLKIIMKKEKIFLAKLIYSATLPFTEKWMGRERIKEVISMAKVYTSMKMKKTMVENPK